MLASFLAVVLLCGPMEVLAVRELSLKLEAGDSEGNSLEREAAAEVLAPPPPAGPSPEACQLHVGNDPNICFKLHPDWRPVCKPICDQAWERKCQALPQGDVSPCMTDGAEWAGYQRMCQQCRPYIVGIRVCRMAKPTQLSQHNLDTGDGVWTMTAAQFVAKENALQVIREQDKPVHVFRIDHKNKQGKKPTLVELKDDDPVYVGGDPSDTAVVLYMKGSRFEEDGHPRNVYGCR